MHLNIFLVWIIAVCSVVMSDTKSYLECERRSTCKECVPKRFEIFNICKWCSSENKCRSHSQVFPTCFFPTMSCPDEAKQPKYDPDEAYNNLLLSALAYSDDPVKCLSENMQDLKAYDYKIWDTVGVNCNFAEEYDDCFSIVAVSERKSRIVVVFRGTASNLQLYDQLMAYLNTRPMNMQFDQIGGTVNAYFLNAFQKMYPCVKNSVSELLRKKDTYGTYEVIITGHSLGGALAALAAVSLIADRVVSESKVTLYTYGEPKVGDVEFAHNFNRIVKRSWRIVHSTDIVTAIPPGDNSLTSPFHHNTMVYYPSDYMDRHSFYDVCSDPQKPECIQPFAESILLSYFFFGPSVVTGLVAYQIYVGNHLSYFNIDVGSYCPSIKRALPRPLFAASKCMQTPITRPTNEVAGIEVKWSKASDCSFEVDFCDWSRTNTRPINFIRHKGPTDAGRKTGPQDKYSSYFIFADASNNIGKTAIIRSANFPNRNYCITLYYHMYGKDIKEQDAHTGELRVKLHIIGDSEARIWKRSGNQGPTWHRLSCNVKSIPMNVIIYFEIEASIGDSFLSDTAIDDVSIQPGTCEKVENCYNEFDIISPKGLGG